MDARLLGQGARYRPRRQHLGTIRLLESRVEHEVAKVVFATTDGTVYGSMGRSRPQRTTRSTLSYEVFRLACER